MRKNGIFKGLNRNVVVLSETSFFTDISSEMLYPVIPIFLTSVLGAPVSVLGLIEGVAEATASIMKAFSGWLSDIFHKRSGFVISGYLLSSLGKLLLFFTYAWPMMLIARFVDRFGKGVRTSPRDALLADSSPAEYRGKAFGFHRAMDTLGACIGPLLALFFLIILKDNMRPIFLIAFIPAILAVLILTLFLKEKKSPPARWDPAAAVRSGFPGRDWKLNIFSPKFKKFIFVSCIFAVGNSSDAFLIIRSKDIGLSLSLVILAYVVYNISYSALSFPFGILSDKIDRKWVIVGGFTVFAFVYFGFGLYISRFTVWILFAVYGFYMAMTDGVSKAYISDMVGQGSRATAIGLYYCVIGILSFSASLIAGLLWTCVSKSAPFIYGAAMASLSAVLCAFLL